jgi:hypothetical protein
LESAAAIADRSPRTAYRWLATDEGVRAALAEAQATRIGLLSAAVMSRAEAGLRVLDELLSDPEIAPYVKLGAAKTALDMAVRLFEFSEMASRLDRLEQRLETWQRAQQRETAKIGATG